MSLSCAAVVRWSGCALAVVLLWGAEWAQADGPLYPRTPPGATELPPGVPPVNNSPSKTPIRDWYRFGRPIGCWSSFNGYGCDSLHAELAFVFGSCRTFYGEPCLKGAPPSPMPPWAGIGAPPYAPGPPGTVGAHPGVQGVPGVPQGVQPGVPQPGCGCKSW